MGPRAWQCALLAKLGRRLREAHEFGRMLPILMARASGHGVGKSTVAAWVLLWGLSTMPNTRIYLGCSKDISADLGVFAITENSSGALLRYDMKSSTPV